MFFNSEVSKGGRGKGQRIKGGNYIAAKTFRFLFSPFLCEGYNCYFFGLTVSHEEDDHFRKERKGEEEAKKQPGKSFCRDLLRNKNVFAVARTAEGLWDFRADVMKMKNSSLFLQRQSRLFTFLPCALFLFTAQKCYPPFCMSYTKILL